MADYATLRGKYLTASDEFTELNKEYNRAARTGDVPDDLELKFMKAERELHAAYRAQQDAKAADPAAAERVHGSKDKPHKEK